MHAVHRLYQYRKSLSTKPFNARGKKVNRCEQCRLDVSNCICQQVPDTSSNAGFVLLMYDTEVLKPSNTGKLIADLISDTYAFLWDRTTVNQEFLSLISDEKWQPMVVFPSQYADENCQIFENKVEVAHKKRPLFILLDGSWREAKKMYRKSPYLANLPVVSFSPSDITSETSRYQIRQASLNNQLATAEVAAKVLAMYGEQHNAQLLELWFDVFSYQYQKSVCQTNKGNANAWQNLESFLQQKK